MPLEKCPQMKGRYRCPHKQDACDHPQSANCHYVVGTLNGAASTAITMRMFGSQMLSGRMQDQLMEINRFLEVMDPLRGNEED